MAKNVKSLFYYLFKKLRKPLNIFTNKNKAKQYGFLKNNVYDIDNV